MTHFLSDPGSKVKFVHAESSTLSVPVYEICAEVINLQELESCLQYCRDQQAGLVLWKTHRKNSQILGQYVGRKCTYTQEVSIYTIHLNLSLIACLQSRYSSSQTRYRQVDKLESNEFCVDPCSLSKTFSDPNFTSAEVTELFFRKVEECNLDQSQYFILPEPEQNLVGFVAVKTENATARSTLMYVIDNIASEDFVGLICSVLTSLLSCGIATCTFEIQDSNKRLKNLILECGGIFAETIVYHNFWFSTEEVPNDQEKSEIPLNIPFITGNELENVKKILDTSSISTHNEYGPYCERYLEKSLGCIKALLVSSGTSALELCSLALNLGPGDEVIMPSYTFVSTANAFVVHGATPVFIDVRKDTLNIDENLIENAVTPKTKAIVVVHYAGVSCEMDVIMKIARKYKLYVIEDNAHGVYGKYKEKYLGTIGHLSALSFHYTKNLSCGEGGAVLINDYKLISQCFIAWEKGTNRYDFMLGKVNKYSWVGKGSSFILSEISASLLAAQLDKHKFITTERRRIWDEYHKRLESLEREGKICRPTVPNGCDHNGHIYRILISEQQAVDKLLKLSKEHKIGIFSHYLPLHSSKGGVKYGRTCGDMKNTDMIFSRLYRLPLWIGITNEQIVKVIELIRLAVNH